MKVGLRRLQGVGPGYALGLGEPHPVKVGLRQDSAKTGAPVSSSRRAASSEGRTATSAPDTVHTYLITRRAASSEGRTATITHSVSSAFNTLGEPHPVKVGLRLICN